ncbi:MAG: peptidoglycan-binding domain-containing protein [Candidatus Omnitrophica bacterium]|nr:peptidoglycan-binding domain-containing protein [Candidatus Omnitrophota bacterium]
MNKLIFLVIPLFLLLSGCATSKKVSQIEQRIAVLENKTAMMEQKQEPVVSESKDTSESTGVKSDTGETASKDISMSIRDVQTALKNAGFYKGTIDGKIGKNTRKAIRAFQKANDLKVDGIIGSKTKDALAKYLNAGTK